MSGTTERCGIDGHAHENIADTVSNGKGIHGLFRFGRGFLLRALVADLRVGKLEERETFGGVNEIEETKADEDGAVEACYELEIRERGELHDVSL